MREFGKRPLARHSNKPHLKRMNSDATDLTGKMLIAMPGMGDPRFAHSVIYMCTHSDDGSMGIIVNKPTPDLRFTDLLKQLKLSPAEGTRDIRVHFGGPVERGRGFVLHSADYKSDQGTMEVSDAVSMTATLDVLEQLANGDGPDRSMLALGYAGWGPGQLEDEILQNGWLTCDPTKAILFGRADEHKWSAALKSIGVDPLSLSSVAGRA